MLIIRPEQFAALAAGLSAALDADAARFLGQRFPELDADARTSLAQAGRAKAMSFGITAASDVHRLLACMVVLGVNLEDDPEAAQILFDQTLTPAAKVARVEERACR